MAGNDLLISDSLASGSNSLSASLNDSISFKLIVNTSISAELLSLTPLSEIIFDVSTLTKQITVSPDTAEAPRSEIFNYLLVENNAKVTKDLEIGTDVIVNRNAFIKKALFADIISSSDGILKIIGDTSIYGKLFVDDFAVNSDILVNGTLLALVISSPTGALTIANDTSIYGKLLANSVAVDKSLTVNGKISSKDLILNNDANNVVSFFSSLVEENQNYLMPIKAPKNGQVLSSHLAEDSNFIQQEWIYQPVTIFVDDFLFSSPWEIKNLKNITFLERDDFLNVTNNDLFYGLAEIPQNGNFSLPFLQFDLAYMFDSIITFRVKPKFLHNVRVVNSINLSSIEQIFPTAPGEILITDGTLHSSKKYVEVGGALSTFIQTYIAVGEKQLSWRLKSETLCQVFFGIFDNFGFTIDVLGAETLDNQNYGAINLSNGLQQSTQKVLAEYSFDSQNEPINLEMSTEEIVDEQVFGKLATISVSGSDKKFILPSGFINLNIIILNGVVSLKINDYIVSQFNLTEYPELTGTLGSSNGDLSNFGKIGGISDSLNFYVDLIKVDQFKKLDDNIFGNKLNLS